MSDPLDSVQPAGRAVRHARRRLGWKQELLLALYAFTVFRYVTAALASFFIGRDAESQKGEVAGARELRALRLEVKALREAMSALSNKLESGTRGAEEP